jgi:hypothetical protein
MADAKFSIGQVNITDYLRLIVREVSNPTAEVANIVYDPPQPTSRNIVITDLNPVMHYFDFYECTGPSDNPGTLLSTFTIDVGLINQTAIEFIEFIVDGGNAHDPASGTITYTNTELDGADYNVTQRGIGPRSFQDEIEKVAGGGFKLLNGEKFNSLDRWFIIVALTTTTVPPIISKGLFADVLEITTNTTISSTHYNCLLEANASGAILTITFPSLSSIPENTMFGFNTHFGSQRYMTIQLQSGEKIRFMGAEKNVTWLGKRETLCIIKKGSLLKVFEYNGDYLRVGEIVKSNIQLPNSLPETGGWYNNADYPRFYTEYVSQIISGQLSAISGGNPVDRTKFALDTVGNRFWVPDTGGYFERNVDPDANIDTDRTSGNRYTGTIQDQTTGEFIITGALAAVSGGNAGTPNMTVLATDIVPPFNGGPTDVTINAGIKTKPVNVAVNSWRII